jgi:hypothetical protein
MRKHTHRGRPIFKLVWANQYGKKWKCTKCDYIKSRLTQTGFDKLFNYLMKKYKQKFTDNIFNENPMFKALKLD